MISESKKAIEGDIAPAYMLGEASPKKLIVGALFMLIAHELVK